VHSHSHEFEYPRTEPLTSFLIISEAIFNVVDFCRSSTDTHSSAQFDAMPVDTSLVLRVLGEAATSDSYHLNEILILISVNTV